MHIAVQQIKDRHHYTKLAVRLNLKKLPINDEEPFAI